jgi:hypothetical protein
MLGSDEKASPFSSKFRPNRRRSKTIHLIARQRHHAYDLVGDMLMSFKTLLAVARQSG